MKLKTIIKLAAAFITVYTVGEIAGSAKTFCRMATINSSNEKIGS